MQFWVFFHWVLFVERHFLTIFHLFSPMTEMTEMCWLWGWVLVLLEGDRSWLWHSSRKSVICQGSSTGWHGITDESSRRVHSHRIDNTSHDNIVWHRHLHKTQKTVVALKEESPSCSFCFVTLFEPHILWSFASLLCMLRRLDVTQIVLWSTVVIPNYVTNFNACVVYIMVTVQK